jgi:hypothetical protein
MTDADLRAALEALQSFLAASARGDREGMQRALTRASIAEEGWDAPSPPDLEMKPGTPVEDGERVLVPMRLQPPGLPADQEPIARFTSVLLREDGVWKLDIPATRAQGSPEMEALADQMMEQLGSALSGAMEQMNHAMQQVGEALGDALGGRHARPEDGKGDAEDEVTYRADGDDPDEESAAR